MRKILVTGGAGFIGRNLVKSLLNDKEETFVRVLDNLSTGKIENIEEFIGYPNFEFINGDIRDKNLCRKACIGIDYISHQAALGSVPRSIIDPITSAEVNVNGFINILWAAKEANIKRIVYASSSSVYGDLNHSPKVETTVGKILSPYAATKMANELFAEAFAKNYGITLCGLRYFNVFGPFQDPSGPYSAVIPLFFKAALNNTSAVINGDGTITRDFTPIINVVNINKLSLFSDLQDSKNYIFNVACGQSTTLIKIWEIITTITGNKIDPVFSKVREGDILQSLADVNYAKEILGYKPFINLEESLVETFKFYQSKEN
jgi:UDP-N-acetylglucosamine 4-epimerase